MSVESDFFSKLINTGDYDLVDKENISAKFFSGSYKTAFRYVQEFKSRYGKVPSDLQFTKRFPQIPLDFDNTVEPLLFYVDEVRNKARHNTIADALEKSTAKLEELNSEEALKIINSAIAKIDSDFTKSEVVLYNENAVDRFKSYELRKNCGGIIGMSTDIEQLDYVLGGIKDTDLLCFVGSTGVGKSWQLCILASRFARQGYKVGFITREMSGQQLTLRMDAINANISYSDFRSGKLSPQDEQKYLEFLKNCDKNKHLDIIIEAVTGGVTSIGTFVDRHKPDILLIDGGYLYTDDSEDSDWKGMMETFRSFKSSICMNRKIPVITNSQMPAGGKSASLANISFSKAIANEVDVMLALEQNDELRNVRQLRVKPLKLRDSGNYSPYVCNWDFHSMNYMPIYSERNDGTFEKPQAGAVKKMEIK